MVFAHQGGWDEILFALTPLVVVAGLLWLANRRATAIQRGRTGAGTVEGGAPTAPDPSTSDDAADA